MKGSGSLGWQVKLLSHSSTTPITQALLPRAGPADLMQRRQGSIPGVRVGTELG
jgi:hypothetical protein